MSEDRPFVLNESEQRFIRELLVNAPNVPEEFCKRYHERIKSLKFELSEKSSCEPVGEE